MIPKKLHYCWFGGNPLSELAKKCILSWEKFFPEYEIIEWNENNFDINICEYVKEAYQAKKWAFVSDYARFWILYNEGGLYFDTDVEVIKNMDDIIEQGAFMGCESKEKCDSGITLDVNPGLGLGVNPGLSIYKEILDSYAAEHFLKQNGRINYKTVVERTTNILKKYGLKETNNIQKVAGITIYPKEYFCPLDYESGNLEITENSRSIHWYDASWLDERMKIRRARCEKIRNRFRGKKGIIISKFYMSLSYYWEWITTGDFCEISIRIKNVWNQISKDK